MIDGPPDELAAAQNRFLVLLSTPFSSRFRCTQSVSTRTILFVGLLMVNKAYQRKSVGRVIVTGLMQSGTSSEYK